MISKFRCLAVIATVMVFTSAASAGLIAEFNYNAELSPGNASTDNASTPSTTSGSFFPFTSALPLQTGSSADTNPVIINGGPNNANAQRTGPAPGEESGSRKIGWNVSTEGYTDPTISWDFLGGYRTSRFYQIYATTDGTNFDPVPVGTGSFSFVPSVGSAIVFADGLISVNINDTLIPEANPTDAPDYFFNLSYSFPSGTAYDNNPNFGVQIAAVHDSAAGDYVSSFAGTTAADAVHGYTRTTADGGGTVRYDLVRVSGTFVPEPTGMALVMCGLSIWGLRRRD